MLIFRIYNENCQSEETYGGTGLEQGMELKMILFSNLRSVSCVADTNTQREVVVECFAPYDDHRCALIRHFIMYS